MKVFREMLHEMPLKLYFMKSKTSPVDIFQRF